jgi:hypothetical protein
MQRGRGHPVRPIVLILLASPGAASLAAPGTRVPRGNAVRHWAASRSPRRVARRRSATSSAAWRCCIPSGTSARATHFAPPWRRARDWGALVGIQRLAAAAWLARAWGDTAEAVRLAPAGADREESRSRSMASSACSSASGGPSVNRRKHKERRQRRYTLCHQSLFSHPEAIGQHTRDSRALGLADVDLGMISLSSARGRARCSTATTSSTRQSWRLWRSGLLTANKRQT